MRRFRPLLEPFEPRVLPTLVFVFNGNAFAATAPGQLTQIAANLLEAHGDRAIQISTPAIGSAAAFHALANKLLAISGGQPIGLLGFSAGGSLAARLSQVSALHVVAALNYYGPPDLQDWFAYHAGDYFEQYVTSHVRLTSDFINVMSGPSNSRAFVVNAFGNYDQNVVSSISTASFQRDFRNGAVFTYPGPHGASPLASIPAFNDFVAHLGGSVPQGFRHFGGWTRQFPRPSNPPGGTVWVPSKVGAIWNQV
jgi:hypothetical protein